MTLARRAAFARLKKHLGVPVGRDRKMWNWKVTPHHDGFFFARRGVRDNTLYIVAGDRVTVYRHSPESGTPEEAYERIARP